MLSLIASLQMFFIILFGIMFGCSIMLALLYTTLVILGKIINAK